MATTQVEGFRFGDIYIDARNRQLWRGGQLAPLNSKYFEVLLLLVRQRGQLVEKQRIFDEVWDGVFVSDSALTQCIKDVRKQLGDDASNPRYIKTVPKHGYIFIARVAEHLTGPDTAPATRPPSARPYKFLDYYGEQDAELFFGREAEIEILCSRILAHRSFILHGRSGVGKSSLARAGLLPRMKSEVHRVFILDSFTDPLSQMAQLAARPAPAELQKPDVKDFQESVMEYYVNSHGKTILFFDQFEDFFASLDPAQRDLFLNAMADLYSNQSLPLHSVFILREDFLSEMSDLKKAIPEIFHHEYRLQRLTRDQSVRAILEPANLLGCRFEAELVDRILRDLIEDDRVDPPQLQITCDTLYDARDSTNNITLGVYERLGGAALILSGYFERVLGRLSSADLRLAHELLKSLISPEGHCAVVRAAELEARVRNATAGEPVALEPLIQVLTDARILRGRIQDGDRWLELAHEFLIPEISRWLTLEDRSLLEARAVLRRAMENYRAYRLHVDLDALALLLKFGERLCLMPEEADLLLVSILQRDRSAPEWLVRAAPSARRMVRDASQSPDSSLRIGAVRAFEFVGDEEMKGRLRVMALEDPAPAVREEACMELAQWLGTDVVNFLFEGKGERDLWRCAGSLAIIRDRDRGLVAFPLKSGALTILVFFALMGLRLRREAKKIFLAGIGGTLGGGLAGAAGSFLLAVALTAARHEQMNEAVSLIFVLTCLGSVIGALGALGVSFGLVVGAALSRRHWRLCAVLAGAAGGAAIGGSGKLLGVDALKTLFGQNPSGVTGSWEGAILGTGLALGAVLAGRNSSGLRDRRSALGMAAGGLVAGAFLAAIGGNLFSGSLEVVARSFADSRIRMDPIAGFFGETQFGKTTQMILGAVEGLIFGAGVGAGLQRGTPRSLK